MGGDDGAVCAAAGDFAALFLCVNSAIESLAGCCAEPRNDASSAQRVEASIGCSCQARCLLTNADAPSCWRAKQVKSFVFFTVTCQRKRRGWGGGEEASE